MARVNISLVGADVVLTGDAADLGALARASSVPLQIEAI